MTFGNFLTRLRDFAKDYYDLMRSGLFMHAAYAKQHLKTPFLLWLALPHYLLIGEIRGFRPNPFFDPAFFKRQSGTARLIDYLRDMYLWRYPTSDFFDSRWYTEKYSAELATTENPLQHFWTKGFERDNRPSPRFDMIFFRRAIARDQANIRDYAYEIASMPYADMPQNSAELEARQRAFYDAIELKTLKRSAAPEKSFLVFIQAGRDHDPHFDHQSAAFDLLINYYDASTHIGDAQYVFAQKGTKTTAIKKILDLCPEILLAYEAVLFLDDDIIISQTQIDALFATQAKQQIDLMQASLSEESECYYPILKQPLAGQGLRPISGVEIMMPLISKRALAECGWVFGECVSGWCVDMLLSAEVRKRFGNHIALCGDVVATHPRATDMANNAFYKFLGAQGIQPRVEAGKIAIKFGINDKMSAVDFRIIDPDAAEISRSNEG
jgi:hypothetical protein